MTIHNQDLTDTSGLDLNAFIQKHGPPHYPTKRNPVGTLNERFWAAFLATFNEFIYENREDQFYRYGGNIYLPTSGHLLREQLSNDIERAAGAWPDYRALAQLCNARHLSGVLAHLKGMVQLEGVFNRKREYIHAANGVILLNGAEPELVSFNPKFISRNLIPIEYQPDAECPEFINQLLKPLPDEDIAMVQKLFGMFLSGVNFLQKILILQGAPQSGKSALAAVARLLLGAVNCEELRTAHLGERFELARYIAKTLLIGGRCCRRLPKPARRAPSQKDDRRRRHRTRAQVFERGGFNHWDFLHVDYMQFPLNDQTRRRPRCLAAQAHHPELRAESPHQGHPGLRAKAGERRRLGHPQLGAQRLAAREQRCGGPWHGFHDRQTEQTRIRLAR
jgi:hypothetical protein